MKKLLMMVPVVALAAGTTGCATKKFVRTEVGSVNEKVTTLTSRVEENETRIKANETKINEVDTKYDQRVGQVDQKATAAGQSASAAAQAAKDVDGKMTAFEANSRKLVYGLRDQRGVGWLQVRERRRCRTRRRRSSTSWWPAWPPTRRPCSSRSRATRTRPVPRRPTRLIGLERAEAVKRYLYEQHHVPLHKISVISYGETKPVDSNGTRAGRARNRRVEVKVLSPEAAAAEATTARTGSN